MSQSLISMKDISFKNNPCRQKEEDPLFIHEPDLASIGMAA